MTAAEILAKLDARDRERLAHCEFSSRVPGRDAMLGYYDLIYVDRDKWDNHAFVRRTKLGRDVLALIQTRSTPARL